MLNLDSFSWLKSRYQSIIDLCTEWTTNRYNPYNMVRSVGGEAYNKLLGIVCPPSLEVLAYDSQGNINGVPTGFTFVRSSNATAFGADGKLYNASDNELRHEWDPVTGEYKGWLIEGPRTNYIKYSEDFSTNSFSDNVTISTNQIIAPDGNITADQIVSTVTGGSNTALVDRALSGIADNTQYTFSCFLKQGTSSISSINLYFNGGSFVQAVGTITWGTTPTYVVTGSGTGGLINVGNGWYRAWLTLNNGSSGNTYCTSRVYVRDQGTSNVTGEYVYAWGRQTELGYFPTSYIPTTTASATRAGDKLSILTSNFPFNITEGTLYGEYTAIAVGDPNLGNTVLELTNATVANRIILSFADSYYDAPGLYVDQGSVQQVSQSNTTQPVVPGIYTRQAINYKLNDYYWIINGNSSLARTDTTAVVPTSLTLLTVGAQFYTDWGTPSAVLNGHIKHIMYFPRKLSVNEMILLTS